MVQIIILIKKSILYIIPVIAQYKISKIYKIKYCIKFEFYTQAIIFIF